MSESDKIQGKIVDFQTRLKKEHNCQIITLCAADITEEEMVTIIEGEVEDLILGNLLDTMKEIHSTPFEIFQENQANK